MTPEPQEEPDVLSWGLLKRFLNRFYPHGACDTSWCRRPAHDRFGQCRRCEKLSAKIFDAKLRAPLPPAVVEALAKRIREGDLPVHKVRLDDD